MATGRLHNVRSLEIPGGDGSGYVLDVDGGPVSGARRLIEGANVTLDDSVPGELTVSATDTALPAGGAEGETLAKLSGTDGDADWIEGSVPIILLPNGSDDSDVPAGTPVGAIIVTMGA